MLLLKKIVNHWTFALFLTMLAVMVLFGFIFYFTSDTFEQSMVETYLEDQGIQFKVVELKDGCHVFNGTSEDRCYYLVTLIGENEASIKVHWKSEGSGYTHSAMTN